MNPITKTIDKLCHQIRRHDPAVLTECRDQLQDFANEWLVAGTEGKLSPDHQATLSDTDITEAIKEAIDIHLE